MEAKNSGTGKHCPFFLLVPGLDNCPTYKGLKHGKRNQSDGRRQMAATTCHVDKPSREVMSLDAVVVMSLDVVVVICSVFHVDGQ